MADPLPTDCGVAVASERVEEDMDGDIVIELDGIFGFMFLFTVVSVTCGVVCA